MKKLALLLALTLCASSAYALVPTTNLVAAWNFNEGTGTTAADTAPSMNYNGSLINGALWTTSGKIINATDLDGTNDFVQIANSGRILNLTNAPTYTIVGWFNPDVGAGGSGSDTIISKFNASTPEFFVNLEPSVTTPYIRFQIYNTAGAAYTLSYSPGLRQTGMTSTWYFFAIRLNATTSQVGISNSTTVSGFSWGNASGVSGTRRNVTTDLLVIGSQGDGAGNDHFDGMIDAIQIFNTSINDSTILEIFNSYTGCEYPGACFASSAPATTYLSINASDAYNFTSLFSFSANVTFNGSTTQWSTTNGTINTNLSTSALATANVTVFTPGFYASTVSNYGNSALLANLTPYIYNLTATYRSDNIPISGVNNFTPRWTAYVPTGTAVALNFTCNAEAGTPSWTAFATNNTLTGCPVAGSQFAYVITLNTTNNRTSPRVTNLTIDFVFGNFSITAFDGTNGTAISVFNATIDGFFYSTSTGSIVSNYSLGSMLNVVVNAAYYNSYVNASLNASAPLAANLTRTVPPAAANISYVAGLNFLLVNWTNANATLVSGFRLYRDGVFVTNVPGSTTQYNFSNLSTNTNYTIGIEAFTPVGASTNTSFVAATLYNPSPVITRIYPTTANASLEENATTTFIVEVESTNSINLFIEWFVDGVLSFWEWITSGDESEFDFFTNYTASGEYNVTVVATDVYNDSASLYWNVTVEDTYPAPNEPYAVLPTGGDYEYEIPLLCAIDYEPVRPAYFEFVYRLNNGSYTDMNIITTDGFVVFDTAAYGYGANFSFGCRVNTSSGVSNYTYSDTFTRVDKNHFYLFETGKEAQYNALKPYTLGFVFEADNSISASLYIGFADCNGDGVWDYTFDYRDENLTRARETFSCVNARGTFETTIGMTLFKNNTASWETLGCSGLAADEELCAVYKSYEVLVE